MIHFPAGYKCSSWEQQIWPSLEAKMLPFIKIKARKIRRFNHGIGYEDAVQEGRMALLAALSRYDFNKGDLEPYANRVLDNTYKNMMYEMLCESRMPRAIVCASDGEWERRPMPPLSFGSMVNEDGEPTEALARCLEDDGNTPEINAELAELEQHARVFRREMYSRLKDRDRHVFFCRTNPPVAFLKMVQEAGGDINKPTNLHVAKYLGINKNAVDWSLYKIRELFVAVARETDFSELFGDAVGNREWPSVFVSNKSCRDEEFIGDIIRQHQLDPRAWKGDGGQDDLRTADGNYARKIERYDWGAVLVLKYQRAWRTVVAIGRLNEFHGVVHGANNSHAKIPVKWYSKLVKEVTR